MREITLQPGESLTIDGLTIKCEHGPKGDSATLLCSQRVIEIVINDLRKNGPVAREIREL